MAEAWTGVMRVKPIEATASKVHCDSGGVRASHDREDGFGFGAICSRFEHEKASTGDLIIAEDCAEKKTPKRYRLDRVTCQRHWAETGSSRSTFPSRANISTLYSLIIYKHMQYISVHLQTLPIFDNAPASHHNRPTLSR
jgi:hypothetical protein